MKQIHARSLAPLTILCRLILCRNRIVGIKSTEMVNPDNIVKL